MAYTLGDPFRPLRLLLRLNGIIIGLLLGLFLLVAPGSLFLRWELAVPGALWLLRLNGANLIALGCFLLIAAGQDTMNRVLLFTATLTHVLWALTLFFAYLQQELVLGSVVGQLLFVLLFVLCLLGAVLPLRYIRSGT
ncbi:MAG: hypothetical protein KDE53_04850 [Caldilineaceae bacterium]|nr:hypothetical protein [Caldilineaceae bacterium]MCB0124713.1 hypothetical protein [Caldilineaceae bacterium]MCB0184500.1 hypothetical protein [Caldilineaceae bacterium]